MKETSSISRRGFLRRSIAASTVFAVPVIIPACARGRAGRPAPSERVVVGHIGVGDRGSYLLGEMVQVKNAQVVAVCDVKRDRREKAAQVVNDTYEMAGCAVYKDSEALIARTDIDAVAVASCDHWHVLHALAAIRNAKGVYVEKPLGITIEEDQVLRRAVQKHDGIFQFGTQQRSAREFWQACTLARNGYIGKLKEIRVWAPPSVAGGPTAQAPVPDTLDYDHWLGQAPFTPYTLERDSNKWWWHISDYATGFIAGWGIHPVDIAFWGAGDLMRTPCTIEGVGKFPTGGVCNCAIDWNINIAYDSGVVVDFRAAPAPPEWLQKYGTEGRDHGTVFIGDKGWVHVKRGEINTSPGELAKFKFPETDKVRLYESKHHIRNFIDCVYDHKPTVAPIEDAVQSDMFCMACDTAIRLRQRLRWDSVKEKFTGPGADEANKRHSRTMRAPWSLKEA